MKKYDTDVINLAINSLEFHTQTFRNEILNIYIFGFFKSYKDYFFIQKLRIFEQSAKSLNVLSLFCSKKREQLSFEYKTMTRQNLEKTILGYFVKRCTYPHRFIRKFRQSRTLNTSFILNDVYVSKPRVCW